MIQVSRSISFNRKTVTILFDVYFVYMRYLLLLQAEKKMLNFHIKSLLEAFPYMF